MNATTTSTCPHCGAGADQQGPDLHATATGPSDAGTFCRVCRQYAGLPDARGDSQTHAPIPPRSTADSLATDDGYSTRGRLRARAQRRHLARSRRQWRQTQTRQNALAWAIIQHGRPYVWHGPPSDGDPESGPMPGPVVVGYRWGQARVELCRGAVVMDLGRHPAHPFYGRPPRTVSMSSGMFGRHADPQRAAMRDLLEHVARVLDRDDQAWRQSADLRERVAQLLTYNTADHVTDAAL